MKILPLVPPDRQGRQCGPCSLCCDLFPVPELQKDAGESCRHCHPPHGCGIHASRPAVCRSFDCAWLKGAGSAEDRPDLAGLFIAGTAELEGRRCTLCYGRADAIDFNLARLEDLARRSNLPVIVLIPPLEAEGFVIGAEVVIEPNKPAEVRISPASRFSWMNAVPAERVI